MSIALTTAEGVIVALNPFARKLFGYNKGELVGRKIEMLIPQCFHHTHMQHREQYAEQPKNRPMGVGMDLFAVKKGGTEFPVEVSLGSYAINGDKYVIAFVNDISAIKKTEVELEKLNDELEAAVEKRTSELSLALRQLELSKEELSELLQKEKDLSELKSRFVSIASHEFRTPLSTVLSSTYLLQKYTTEEEQPKREKHIERIISSVKTLTEILDDFLSVDKIEEGKVTPKFSNFNISEHINDIISQVKGIQKNRQQIVYNHNGETDVWFDASLMVHTVINLLSNAIKFSPENSTISIDTKGTGAALVLKIKGESVGIPKEDQQHLFERFFHANNVSAIQGTGLGLHIVQKYTELMNGEIEFHSEPEKGAKFIVQFDFKK